MERPTVGQLAVLEQARRVPEVVEHDREAGLGVTDRHRRLPSAGRARSARRVARLHVRARHGSARRRPCRAGRRPGCARSARSARPARGSPCSCRQPERPRRGRWVPGSRSDRSALRWPRITRFARGDAHHARHRRPAAPRRRTLDRLPRRRGRTAGWPADRGGPASGGARGRPAPGRGAGPAVGDRRVAGRRRRGPRRVRRAALLRVRGRRIAAGRAGRRLADQRLGPERVLVRLQPGRLGDRGDRRPVGARGPRAAGGRRAAGSRPARRPRTWSGSRRRATPCSHGPAGTSRRAG